VDFDQLLSSFRRLGGIAENVRLGTGPRGRGIFVADPGKPARLHVPERLLIPVRDLERRDGVLAVKAGSRAGDDARAFFCDYQRHFGWSDGGYSEIRLAQAQWSALPAEVVAFLRATGTLDDPERRFAAPGEDACFYQFVRARDYRYGDDSYLAPVLDLVNHAGDAPGYAIGDGIAAAGTFAGEMLVRYNIHDAWANALTYGFGERSFFAYAVGSTIALEDGRQLIVRRDAGQAQMHAGIRMPVCEITGNVLRLSHLTLGNLAAPDLPRAIFRHLLAPSLNAAQADRAFDGIAHFNRQKFVEAIRLLDRHDGPIVAMLRDAALHQLETLSAAVGARPL